MAFAMMDFDEEYHKKISIGNLMMIEELEKIKAEIEKIDNIVHEHGATYINKYAIVKVFNNHIAELKGEQE